MIFFLQYFFIFFTIKLQNNFLVFNFQNSSVVFYQNFYLLSKNVLINESKKSHITIFFIFRIVYI